MAKIIKRKTAPKNSENDQLPSEEDLLIRQENNWKSHSTVYDEIREDCRLDSLHDLGNIHSQHPEGELLCDVEDISEDYLDFLLGFD